MIVNFAVSNSSRFREKKSYCDGEVGGGGGVNTICSRPEVADAVISGQDVESFNHCVNIRVASLNSFRKIDSSHLCNA